MAFHKLTCRACQHTFYRITVRCGKLDAAERCSLCHATNSKKTLIRPRKNQISAEEKACCRESGSCGCGR